METAKLIVRNIIGSPFMTEKGSFSRVTINTELFRLVASAVPKLPFTTSTDNGKKVRVFSIDGVTLYSYFDYENLRPLFFMDTYQAQSKLETMDARNSQSPISIGLSHFLEAEKTGSVAMA